MISFCNLCALDCVSFVCNLFVICVHLCVIANYWSWLLDSCALKLNTPHGLTKSNYHCYCRITVSTTVSFLTFLRNAWKVLKQTTHSNTLSMSRFHRWEWNWISLRFFLLLKYHFVNSIRQFYTLPYLTLYHFFVFLCLSIIWVTMIYSDTAAVWYNNERSAEWKWKNYL